MPAPPSLPSLSLAAQATTYLVGDHARGVATATADPDTAVGVGEPASAFALASSLTIAYSSACASSRTDLHGAACRGRVARQRIAPNCAQNCARLRTFFTRLSMTAIESTPDVRQSPAAFEFLDAFRSEATSGGRCAPSRIAPMPAEAIERRCYNGEGSGGERSGGVAGGAGGHAPAPPWWRASAES